MRMIQMMCTSLLEFTRMITLYLPLLRSGSFFRALSLFLDTMWEEINRSVLLFALCNVNYLWRVFKGI